MIERRLFLARMAGVVATGILGKALRAEMPPARAPITVYKSSSCGCCAKWVDHLKANGFTPVVHDEEEMESLKDKMGVPPAVRSCHTAIIDEYFIEGHVPASDIHRLLAERPKAAGLAVPGMPPRTPGMAPPGTAIGGFDVLAFQGDGATRVFARH